MVNQINNTGIIGGNYNGGAGDSQTVDLDTTHGSLNASYGNDKDPNGTGDVSSDLAAITFAVGEEGGGDDPVTVTSAMAREEGGGGAITESTNENGGGVGPMPPVPTQDSSESGGGTSTDSTLGALDQFLHELRVSDKDNNGSDITELNKLKGKLEEKVADLEKMIQDGKDTLSPAVLKELNARLNAFQKQLETTNKIIDNFDKLDASGDGKITQQELLGIAGSDGDVKTLTEADLNADHSTLTDQTDPSTNGGATVAYLDQLLRQVRGSDKNNDGSDMTELTKRQKALEDKIKDLEDLIKDGKDTLSPDVLKELNARLNNCKNELNLTNKVIDNFAKLDTDGDGKVKQEELIAIAGRDGNVTNFSESDISGSTPPPPATTEATGEEGGGDDPVTVTSAMTSEEGGGGAITEAYGENGGFVGPILPITTQDTNETGGGTVNN